MAKPEKLKKILPQGLAKSHSHGKSGTIITYRWRIAGAYAAQSQDAAQRGATKGQEVGSCLELRQRLTELNRMQAKIDRKKAKVAE